MHGSLSRGINRRILCAKQPGNAADANNVTSHALHHLWRDGAAAQARFYEPWGLALLADGTVLVADNENNSIRTLSADLQQVTTVVGGGGEGNDDGAAADATLYRPSRLLALPDGSVLVSTRGRIRMLTGFPPAVPDSKPAAKAVPLRAAAAARHAMRLQRNAGAQQRRTAFGSGCTACDAPEAQCWCSTAAYCVRQ